MVRCPGCRKVNANHYEFCVHCGGALEVQAAPTSQEALAEPPHAPAPAHAEPEAARPASMRAEVRCPACGCRKILHVTEVLDGSGTGRERLALAQPSAWSARRVGELEAFVCTSCRLVEWYVKDLAGVVVDGERVRLLDGDAAGGPYR